MRLLWNGCQSATSEKGISGYDTNLPFSTAFNACVSVKGGNVRCRLTEEANLSGSVCGGNAQVAPKNSRTPRLQARRRSFVLPSIEFYTLAVPYIQQLAYFNSAWRREGRRETGQVPAQEFS